jgi:polygalacturonase
MGDSSVNYKQVMKLLAGTPLLVMTMACAASFSSRLAVSNYDIRDYGAVEGGEKNCTHAIQKAIDTCHEHRGGTVYIPAGTFLTAPLFLKSNVNLYLENGSVLLGSDNFNEYPRIQGRWEDINRECFASLITAMDAENISVTGQGTINGRGRVWWQADEKDRPEQYRRHDAKGDRNLKWGGLILDAPRPRVVNLYRCRNMLLRDFTIVDSPAWTVHPDYCDRGTVDNLRIMSDPGSPNTDGINPDSCSNVRISNCHINCGDDCITLKSGYNEYGREVGIPYEHITITDCVLARGTGGVVIGSEMSGDVRNVTISNCVLDGTNIGVRFKTERCRGGVVENLRVDNLVMRNVDVVIQMTKYYTLFSREAAPVDEGTPVFRNIHLSNISGFGIKEAGQLEGLPEMPIREITFNDINLQAQTGIKGESLDDIHFRDVRIDTAEGPSLKIRDSLRIRLDNFSTVEPHKDIPVVELDNIRRARISGCIAEKGTGFFLNITGKGHRSGPAG